MAAIFFSNPIHKVKQKCNPGVSEISNCERRFVNKIHFYAVENVTFMCDETGQNIYSTMWMYGVFVKTLLRLDF